MMREVTVQTHMNERLAILLLSLPGAGGVSSSLFCRCGCSVRSFVRSSFVGWGLSVPCSRRAFRFLNYPRLLVARSKRFLFKPIAVIKPILNQFPTTRFTDHPLKSIRSSRSLTTTFQVRSRHAELLLPDRPQTTRQLPCPKIPHHS